MEKSIFKKPHSSQNEIFQFILLQTYLFIVLWRLTEKSADAETELGNGIIKCCCKEVLLFLHKVWFNWKYTKLLNMWMFLCLCSAVVLKSDASPTAHRLPTERLFLLCDDFKVPFKYSRGQAKKNSLRLFKGRISHRPRAPRFTMEAFLISFSQRCWLLPLLPGDAATAGGEREQNGNNELRGHQYAHSLKKNHLLKISAGCFVQTVYRSKNKNNKKQAELARWLVTQNTAGLIIKHDISSSCLMVSHWVERNVKLGCENKKQTVYNEDVLSFVWFKTFCRDMMTAALLSGFRCNWWMWRFSGTASILTSQTENKFLFMLLCIYNNLKFQLCLKN